MTYRNQCASILMKQKTSSRQKHPSTYLYFGLKEACTELFKSKCDKTHFQSWTLPKLRNARAILLWNPHLYKYNCKAIVICMFFRSDCFIFLPNRTRSLDEVMMTSSVIRWRSSSGRSWNAGTVRHQ